MKSVLLILTVGTGTAGKYSDLHSGLTATIRKMKPRCYWLVPSADPNSVAMADMVREAAPDGFAPWAPDELFPRIEKPDDIFCCRDTLRRVIGAARQQLKPGEALVVNPTSGTKQMSVGAALAALDEEIGDLVFTVGERADGVVKTGTERLAAFSTGVFFKERDLKSAELLFRNGAFAAAARLLERYADDPEMRARRSKAWCNQEWYRLNYAPAAAAAAAFSAPLAAHLNGLARDVAGRRLSARVLTDVIRCADDLRKWGESEAAAQHYYKALEYAARLRLSLALGGKMPPFRHDDLSRLTKSLETLKELERRRKRDGTCAPGLFLMMDLLGAIGDPLADGLQSEKALLGLLRARNESVHEIRPIADREADSLSTRLGNLLRPHLPIAADAALAPPTSLLP